MTDRVAPRVFVSYAHETQEHKDQVRRFATFLRARVGLDVHLDQWYENERRDWSQWAVDHLVNSDFILVIASPNYKRRADGSAAPDDGRGSQFEAAILRNSLTRNLRDETKRILPVVLPGRSPADIPEFLSGYSTSRFEVPEFTDEGAAELLAVITGRGTYPMPERGEWLDDAEPREVRLATGLPWLASNVRPGSGWIDGVRYDDSILLRPADVTLRGFLEVDLGGAYQWLTSVVGVLDDAAESFQVGHFQVHLDGTPQAESTAALGKPAMIKVDVTGALRLRLEMYRPGRRLPELGWGDPTLS